MKPLISWQAHEHRHVEKNDDWYWAIGIITITCSALAFIFGNPIFGIFIIVSAFALIVHSAKKPKMNSCEINDRGIVIDSVLYPFLNLESFWIDAHERPAQLIVKSTKPFSPYITVQIEQVDPEQVRDILLNYISETEHIEPLSQKIFEF